MTRDRSGITDDVSAVLIHEDGSETKISTEFKGPDPAQWGPDAVRPRRLGARRARAIGDKVKGPDPAVWGRDEDRPQHPRSFEEATQALQAEYARKNKSNTSKEPQS
jgi:hypothetical protein